MILPEEGIMPGWAEQLMPILVRLDWASSVVREGMSRGAPSCPLCELWSELRKKDNSDCKQRDADMHEVGFERVFFVILLNMYH